MNETKLTTKQKHWLEHLKNCEEQGLSLAAYGASKGLSAQQLYQWRHTLRKKGTLPSRPASAKKTPWIPVFSHTQRETSQRCRLKLPNGMELEWDHGYAIESVLQFIESVCRR